MDAARTAAEWPEVAEALRELDERDAVRRLRARDASLWSDDPAHREVAANRLGWLDVVGGKPGWSALLRQFADDIQADGLERVVLAGMGGSSLAPEVFADVLAGPDTRLEILDSTHPDTVDAALAGLDRSLVVVSSKSGTTEETRCFGATAAARAPGPRHLAAVTDPGSELAAEAEAGGWRAVFENPPDIGGRYSALSLFGMAPAVLAGVYVDDVWRRAERLAAASGADVAPADNPAAQLAAFMGGLGRAGRDKLTLLSGPRLAPLGDWVEQLVAESTGKDGCGIVPVVGEPVGAPDDYGDDRAFVELRLAGEAVEGAEELRQAGHPVLTIEVADASELGAEFLRWELATALAAVLLGVDPFDEPNVAESKANTRAVLEGVLDGAELPEPEEGDVSGLLGQARDGDYLSLQCYLAPSSGAAAALADLRLVLRERTGCATTVGWGPRFLHSTGQLHKGGPDTIVALQLVDVPEHGPPIPGRAYDFATLIRAQAVGDLQSLRDHGRRVVQVAVSGHEEISALADAVRAGLGDGPGSLAST